MFCKCHGIENSKGFTTYNYSTFVFVSITEAILRQAQGVEGMHLLQGIHKLL